MENLVQPLLEESTLWVPEVTGAVVIFVVFIILAKIMKRIIIKAAERLKFDKNNPGQRLSPLVLIIRGHQLAKGCIIFEHFLKVFYEQLHSDGGELAGRPYCI